jgi:AcrR family transcriptional regulator
MQVSSTRTFAMRKPKAPEANRVRILAAAVAEFASRGFKGASMDAIAARTDTTRALINYYFGSKEKLYLEVLERQARGRHMKKSAAMRTLNRPIIETLGGVIVRGQADGVFRTDVDAIDVHMAIAALGIFNVANQFTFGAIFQRAMGATGDVPRRRRMVADIVLCWLSRR